MILIAALTKNRVIGKNNAMPWHISAESRHFRKTTIGHTLVMGRKTFESIGGGTPLPGRKTIVISRSMPPEETIDVCRTLEEALEKARSYGKKTFIAGGAEIYTQSLPLANALYLSYIKEDHEGDIYFPEFDESDWEITQKEDHPEFTFVVYQRKNGKHPV